MAKKNVTYTTESGRVVVIDEDDLVIDYEVFVNMTDDDLREEVSIKMAPCTEQEYFDAYLKAYKEATGEDFTAYKSEATAREYVDLFVDGEWVNPYAEPTIKRWRKNAGLTQAKMAELFEIPLRTITNWEQGISSPAPWAERLIVEKLMAITERAAKKDMVARVARAAYECDTAVRWAVIESDAYDMDFTVCNDMAGAIEQAETIWNHLTDSEKAGRTIEVACVALTNEDDEDEEDVSRRCIDNGIGYSPIEWR